MVVLPKTETNSKRFPGSSSSESTAAFERDGTKEAWRRSGSRTLTDIIAELEASFVGIRAPSHATTVQYIGCRAGYIDSHCYKSIFGGQEAGGSVFFDRVLDNFEDPGDWGEG